MPTALQDDLAIVGIACRFAGAADAATFWRHIVANQVAITDHPNPAAIHVLDPASPRFDRLNTLRGGWLRELNTFTPAAFGLNAQQLAGDNPDVFLALQLASAALQDAGLKAEALASRRAGLFLGYAAPLNPATANWLQHGLVVEQTVTLLQRLFPTAGETQLNELRQSWKAALPPIRPAGIRSAFAHALAGRCAATLGLTGAACAVDAGGASSLAALRLAADALRLGRCDVAVVGAVQTCASLHVLMGLACLMDFTTRALPCALGRDADGTLPGEGGGFLVLTRRRDAERQRAPVYALLKGVGLAAPQPSTPAGADPDSLATAMREAHAEAGVTPDTIALVEAHGSAVPREDQMEIQALRQVFGDRAGPQPRILLGTVKPTIGHCFAAAGMAGVIKAALALHHRVLPPMVVSNARLHPRLTQTSSPFHVIVTPRPWVHGRSQPPRRAAVNAFDPACLQGHAVLEEHPESP